MNPSKKKTILILQKEKIEQNKIEKYFNSKGFQTICAEDELEALSLLSYKKIDAVISNIDLCINNSRQMVITYNSIQKNENSPSLQIAA